MKRFELIDGNAQLITVMVNDGWSIVNTFPNPYPQPYFVALMTIDSVRAASYDLNNVKEFVNGNTVLLNQWGIK